MARSERISQRDVAQRVRDDGIEFIELKFVDLFGGLQSLTFVADVLDEGAFQRGVNFDGSSVRGFQSISESDLLLRPDPNTVFLDPFHDAPTLSMFCDIVDPNGQVPYRRDPRGVAHRAERFLQGAGVADEASFGLEIEFYLFDDVRFAQGRRQGYYFVDSGAAAEDSGPVPRNGRNGGYFAAGPRDETHNLRSVMAKLLRTVGIRPELHHHEVGGAGQNEIGFRFDRLVRSADNAVKFKYVVRNAARRYGKVATFMPKPIYAEAGSGMHTNVSLWRAGENLFYGQGGYADLSPTARHFVGGLLKHAPAVCAFSSPSTNSYRRLVPGFEAPVNLAYSQRNRSACIRVPYTGSNRKAKRLEFRTPDPMANPYLSNAAVLMAGLDGVLNRIEPPDPVDEDIFAYARSHEGARLPNVPTSLTEALDALEADFDFLLRGEVFSEDLIRTWLRWKRDREVDHVALRPHPSEFELYFDA